MNYVSDHRSLNRLISLLLPSSWRAAPYVQDQWPAPYRLVPCKPIETSINLETDEMDRLSRIATRCRQFPVISRRTIHSRSRNCTATLDNGRRRMIFLSQSRDGEGPSSRDSDRSALYELPTATCEGDHDNEDTIEVCLRSCEGEATVCSAYKMDTSNLLCGQA